MKKNLLFLLCSVIVFGGCSKDATTLVEIQETTEEQQENTTQEELVLADNSIQIIEDFFNGLTSYTQSIEGTFRIANKELTYTLNATVNEELVSSIDINYIYDDFELFDFFNEQQGNISLYFDYKDNGSVDLLYSINNSWNQNTLDEFNVSDIPFCNITNLIQNVYYENYYQNGNLVVGINADTECNYNINTQEFTYKRIGTFNNYEFESEFKLFYSDVIEDEPSPFILDDTNYEQDNETYNELKKFYSFIIGDETYYNNAESSIETYSDVEGLLLVDSAIFQFYELEDFLNETGLIFEDDKIIINTNQHLIMIDNVSVNELVGNPEGSIDFLLKCVNNEDGTYTYYNNDYSLTFSYNNEFVTLCISEDRG